jgi:hypothetical protein
MNVEQQQRERECKNPFPANSPFLDSFSTIAGTRPAHDDAQWSAVGIDAARRGRFDTLFLFPI